MRLINVYDYTIREFFGADIPSYAILSHTWGDGELTLQDMAPRPSPAARAKQGFRKIAYACAQARDDKLDWAWVDTCCIDKTSSAELSEAINSMFEWYARSAVCYAYLSDVPDPTTDVKPSVPIVRDPVSGPPSIAILWTCQCLLRLCPSCERVHFQG